MACFLFLEGMWMDPEKGAEYHDESPDTVVEEYKRRGQEHG